MIITDSQQERLQWGAEELEDLAHLIAQIVRENADSATSRELRNLGIVWELVGESARELKNLQIKSYEPTRTRT